MSTLQSKRASRASLLVSAITMAMVIAMVLAGKPLLGALLVPPLLLVIYGVVTVLTAISEAHAPVHWVCQSLMAYMVYLYLVLHVFALAFVDHPTTPSHTIHHWLVFTRLAILPAVFVFPRPLHEIATLCAAITTHALQLGLLGPLFNWFVASLGLGFLGLLLIVPIVALAKGKKGVY